MSENINGNGKQSKVVGAVETFGNIFFLNILFIVFSIPIITFGASLTALYSVSLKMIRKEEGTIYHSFVAAFKSNFKKATIAWLLVIAAIAVLYGQWFYSVNTTGVLSTFYMFVLVIEGFIFLLTVQFLFPLIARYENTVLNSIKNSFLLAVSNFWAWIKFTLIWIMPIILCLRYFVIFYYTWYLWLVCGFGLMAFCSSIVARKVFEKIENVQSENKKTEKEKKSKKTSIEEQRKKLIKEKMKRFENKAED